jgi:trigger factor
MQHGGEQVKAPEQVEKEYPSFVNQLKWSLILEKILREQNIEVKPEDIQAFARQQLFGYMGMNAMDEEQPWVTDYLNRMMQDKKFVEDSYHRIQSEKVFGWAQNAVQKEEQPISAEDFTNILQEHQHHHH